MMTKKLVLAVCLLCLALASGCAKGGNGIVITPSIDVTITSPANANSGAIYPTQTFMVTATITNSSTTTVNWSVSGGGTLTPVTPATNPPTATYVAPATALVQPVITATLTSDSTITGTLGLNIVDITTQVSPSSPYVGTGLTQIFTAAAVPDDAPQTFQWTCLANGVPCATFTQDANISGLAYYTANDNCSSNNCIQISAITPLDTNGCSNNPKYCIEVKATPVASRLNGTYAFRFSGYDSSSHAVAVAGTFTAVNGTIQTGGVEDELTSTGPNTQIAISGGSYTPTSSDTNNSNNAGTLTLALPNGIYPNKFQAVLDAAGDVRMIESDAHGTGSGVAEPQTSKNGFNSGDQTYAFGFTGVDSSGHRIGYAGLMPMNGSGTISGGAIDVNDNGSASNGVCSSTPPCALAGTYTVNANGTAGSITLTSPIAMTFDFYVGIGTTGKAANPLTLYAISTDGNPAVDGVMVLQDNTQTYNISAFDGVSVSALTGVTSNGTNVSLTLGTTDGAGDFSGLFDQNNAGTILSAVQFPSGSGTSPYTYSASSSNNGRYIFQMLGNPSASPVVAPIPFILYASGANRGFLLDQSSAGVMTGTMNPEGANGGAFTPSELPGTYAAATTRSGNASVTPIAANLLLTSTGNSTYNVTGTLYPGESALPSGSTYTMSLTTGTGTIVLNSTPSDTFALYPLDSNGCAGIKSGNPACAIQDFFIIDEAKTDTNPSVIFAHQ
jgi:hypothetical protein